MLEMAVTLLGLVVGDCRVPVLEIPLAKGGGALVSGMERGAPKVGGERQRPFQKRMKALRARGRDRRAARGT